MEIRKILLDKIALDHLIKSPNGLIKMSFHAETYRISFYNCFLRFKIRLKMFTVQVATSQIDCIAEKYLMKERCLDKNH